MGWTGSSVQTIPCGPSHRRFTPCVCAFVFCWQLPASAGHGDSLCLYLHYCDFYLRWAVYIVFSLCILSPGRVTKTVGKDVVDREFVFCLYSGIYILVALFSGALVRSLYCCAAQHFGGQSGSILHGTHLCFPWLARCAHLVRSIGELVLCNRAVCD